MSSVGTKITTGAEAVALPLGTLIAFDDGTLVRRVATLHDDTAFIVIAPTAVETHKLSLGDGPTKYSEATVYPEGKQPTVIWTPGS